jgi:NAD(P)-dependent dehydrogenase (short-subunit alcohol dehydrogenase family)
MKESPSARSVLITGAGTGFGRATALHLAANGWRVFASVPDLSQTPGLERAAEATGVELRIVPLDVTDPASVRNAVDDVVAENGEIHALVNNAGLGLRGFFEDLSETEISRLFSVNLFGAMAVTRAVLPHMRNARRGRIVMMSSAGGRLAAMTLSAYCSAKFAIEGFGESLALEMAPFGIHVSMIEPGLVLTPHFTVNRGRAARATDPSSPYYDWFMRHERMVDQLLEKRRITPEDVARTVRKALTSPRPRLRYVVGRFPKLLVFLSRHLPSELFHRIYSRQAIRMVSGQRDETGEAANGDDQTDRDLVRKTDPPPEDVESHV